MPRPLHGRLDLAHGGGGARAGDVSEAGRVLSDAQDEGNWILFRRVNFEIFLKFIL